eukprot:940394-Pelagomonas_calceolata.AAC.1
MHVHTLDFAFASAQGHVAKRAKKKEGNKVGRPKLLTKCARQEISKQQQPAILSKVGSAVSAPLLTDEKLTQ